MIQKEFFVRMKNASVILKHFKIAETARFELAIELPLYTLSRRAPSTTRTRLLQRTAKIRLSDPISRIFFLHFPW